MSEYFPPQMLAAAIRGVIGALLLFGSVTLSTYQAALVLDASSASWTLALIGGGSAALTYLIVRTGGEGTYDSHRNAIGDVQRGDVGATLPARKF